MRPPCRTRRPAPLADKAAAKLAERQQRDEPPRHPEGTLHEPGEAGRKRGLREAPRPAARARH